MSFNITAREADYSTPFVNITLETSVPNYDAVSMAASMVISLVRGAVVDSLTDFENLNEDHQWDAEITHLSQMLDSLNSDSLGVRIAKTILNYNSVRIAMWTGGQWTYNIDFTDTDNPTDEPEEELYFDLFNPNTDWADWARG